MRRSAGWIGVGALVVLGGRSLAYALSPSPLAGELSHRAGGPALPVVAVTSLVLAVGVSAAVVWVAALGVRERRLLEPGPVEFEGRIGLARLLAHAVVLWLAAMPTFALLESYIHWRAGLGWHGLHCLIGPAHRDAIPILGALSLVAAALVGALEHVLAWMRRTLAELAPRVRLEWTRPARTIAPDLLHVFSFAAAPFARGPPLRS